MALRPHHRDHPARQIMGAKEVDLENLAQGAARQVFGGAGAGIGAIVVQRIQRAAGAAQGLGHGGFDAGLIRQIEGETFQPFGPQPFAIRLGPAGGKDPPAAGFQRLRGIKANAGRTSGDQDRTGLGHARCSGFSFGIGAKRCLRNQGALAERNSPETKPVMPSPSRMIWAQPFSSTQSRRVASPRLSLPTTGNSVEGPSRTFTVWAVI